MVTVPVSSVPAWRPDLGITMVVVLAITYALLGATIVALVGIGTGCTAQGLTAKVALGKRLLITGAQRRSSSRPRPRRLKRDDFRLNRFVSEQFTSPRR
jgi:hypothetical protein